MLTSLSKACPCCGEFHYMEYVYCPSFVGLKCIKCGWHQEYQRNSDEHHHENCSVDTSYLADELGMHFCIPCDMCHKWFDCPDCPPEVETCNGKKHWRMMLERILKNEND